MARKSERKQTAISLKIKMDLLKAVDEKRSSKTEICKEFGIANSTLSTIIKKRHHITAMFERSMFEPERKRMRRAKHQDLETALLAWFQQAKAQNAPVSGPVLLERADQFAKQMGIEFSANPGWLERFKKRNCIALKSVRGEPTTTPATDRLPSSLSSAVEQHDAKDIFSVAETSLLYRCLPNMASSVKKHSNGERITVLVGCNSDGSEKLPLFVIGKSLKPACFRNVRKLAVEYAANEKARMVAALFSDWILHLDKRFAGEKRKVAVVVVRHCPAYADIKLKAIKLIFLNPSAGNVTQPCGQGVMRNLKFQYRKQLLRKYLLAVEAKEEFSVSLLDALHMLRSAWDSVTPKTIENCFRQAGLSKMADSLEPRESVEIETEPTFGETFEKACALLDCFTVSPEEFVAVDDDDDDDVALSQTNEDGPVTCWGSEGGGNPENGSDREEVDVPGPVSVPTTSEMLDALRRMRSYLDAHSNGEMNKTMDHIEQFIENTMLRKSLSNSIPIEREKKLR